MTKLTNFSQNLKGAFKGDQVSKYLVAGLAPIPYVILPTALGWDNWKGFLLGFLSTFGIGAMTGRYELCYAAIGIASTHLLHSYGGDLWDKIGLTKLKQKDGVKSRPWNFGIDEATGLPLNGLADNSAYHRYTLSNGETVNAYEPNQLQMNDNFVNDEVHQLAGLEGFLEQPNRFGERGRF